MCRNVSNSVSVNQRGTIMRAELSLLGSGGRAELATCTLEGTGSERGKRREGDAEVNQKEDKVKLHTAANSLFEERAE